MRNWCVSESCFSNSREAGIITPRKAKLVKLKPAETTRRPALCSQEIPPFAWIQKPQEKKKLPLNSQMTDCTQDWPGKLEGNNAFKVQQKCHCVITANKPWLIYTNRGRRAFAALTIKNIYNTKNICALSSSYGEAKVVVSQIQTTTKFPLTSFLSNNFWKWNLCDFMIQS